MKNMETPCRQTHQAILLLKCQETWNHAKPTVLLSDSKGVWELSPKVSVFPTKDADAPSMNNLAGMAMGLKSTHGEMLTLHEDHVVCGECVGSGMGLSCSYLMFYFRWEVKGLHFLMRFHWQDLCRNHRWHYLLKVTTMREMHEGGSCHLDFVWERR